MKASFLQRICLGIFAACLISFVPASAQQNSAGVSKNIAAALQPYVDKGSLAGAVVLVADKDKVLAVEAVGWADIAAKLMMPLDALFWIASQSKPITAAALMLLVDEGKVKLDDPVEKYLPEFKEVMVGPSKKNKDKSASHKPKHAITVREILSHSSGMPPKSTIENPTLDLHTLKEGAASYAKTPLLYEPGTGYTYSNAGINTAGRIIEVVSGMSYEDFLQKRLFDPLGMKDTTFWPNDEQLKRLAKSYKANKAKDGLLETPISQLKYPLNDRKRQPMPAGGLFSTANDVAHFCQMMLGGGVYKGKRILSEGAVKELTKRQTAEGLPSYGLGFSVGNGAFGHGGAYSTDMTIDTKRGLIFVWLVQQAGPFPNNGGESRAAFRKAAESQYSKTKQ